MQSSMLLQCGTQQWRIAHGIASPLPTSTWLHASTVKQHHTHPQAMFWQHLLCAEVPNITFEPTIWL
jgi:hypothetical protein